MDCDQVEGLARKIQAKAKDEHVLTNILIELTHRCNLRCVHCYQKHNLHGEELSTGEWITALHDMAEAGGMFLVITGGEPLLRPDLEEICVEAQKMGFFLRLFTNGALLDKTRLQSLSRIKWQAMEVSLHGADAETHEAITRVPGSFDAVIRALDLLYEAGIALVIKTSITPHNIKSIKNIQEITERYQARHLVSPIITIAKEDDLDNSACRLAPAQLEEYFQLVADIDKSSQDDITNKPGGNRWQETGYYPYLNCNALRISLTISPDGSVIPCLSMPVLLGNIRTHNLYDLWYNDSRVGRLLKWGGKGIPECYKCEYETLCMRCPGDALVEDGSMGIPGKHVCGIARMRWKVAYSIWTKKHT